MKGIAVNGVSKIENIPAHIVGDLAFIVEESWLKKFSHDVTFWERGHSMQHCVTLGVPDGHDPYAYAADLATARGEMLLVQIRDARERAVMMSGEWLL